MSTQVTFRGGQYPPEIRANVFYALSRVYSPPDTWPENLPELLWSAFGSLERDISYISSELCSELSKAHSTAELLATEYAKLFIGPFDLLAPPWASLYLDPEKQLMGETSLYAAEAYAEAGLGPAQGPTDAPDHITRELEFMYFLAFQEHTTGDSVWKARQDRFWREHLGIWLPDFAALVRDSAGESSIYSLIANLTLEFCSS